MESISAPEQEKIIKSNSVDDEQAIIKRKKLNLYRLPPKNFEGKDDVIYFDNLSKVYNLAGREETVRALSKVSLSPGDEFYPIKKGEFIMIRGPSGGGKTTLLNLIGTIDSSSSGELYIMNKRIDQQSSDEFLSELRLKHIGFVFQTFNLLATMSALENVELPMILLGELSDKDRRTRAISLLKRVGLGDRLDHLPSELSGGEQQRVAIARALSNQPDILLLDEPTGDLDSKSTIQVMDLLLNINRVGPNGEGEHSATTCVMVTHNPEIECYADRIIYVQDGTFVKQALNEVQTAIREGEYQRFQQLDDDD